MRIIAVDLNDEVTNWKMGQYVPNASIKHTLCRYSITSKACYAYMITTYN